MCAQDCKFSTTMDIDTSSDHHNCPLRHLDAPTVLDIPPSRATVALRTALRTWSDSLGYGADVGDLVAQYSHPWYYGQDDNVLALAELLAVALPSTGLSEAVPSQRCPMCQYHRRELLMSCRYRSTGLFFNEEFYLKRTACAAWLQTRTEPETGFLASWALAMDRIKRYPVGRCDSSTITKIVWWVAQGHLTHCPTDLFICHEVLPRSIAPSVIS